MEKELALLCKSEKDQKLVNFKVLKTIGNLISSATRTEGKSLEKKVYLYHEKSFKFKLRKFSRKMSVVGDFLT